MRFVTPIVIASLLSGCAGFVGEEERSFEPRRQVADEAAEAMAADLPAIKKYRVGGDVLVARQVKGEPPAHVLARRLDFDYIPGGLDVNYFFEQVKVKTDTPTVFYFGDEERSSAIETLENADNAEIAALRASDTGGESREDGDPSVRAQRVASERMVSRMDSVGSWPLPFRSFNGTLGEALETLEESLGITYWWSNNRLFLSKYGRYTVAVPQIEGLGEEISGELRSFGARNTGYSKRGNMVTYEASAELQANVIGPYLDRLVQNLNQITVQIRIVSVLINDDNEAGLDWNKLKFAFGEESVSDLTQTASNLGSSAGETAKEVTNLVTGGVDSATYSLKKASIFGVTRPLTVEGAVRYISSLGKSESSENLEARTFSGESVSFWQGETIPYVEGVQNTPIGGVGQQTGGNNFGVGFSAASVTKTVETGVKLDFVTSFDGSSTIVTMGGMIDINDLVGFVELNAGSQIGTLTQPRTRGQKMEANVQIPAGHVAVIGGLRRERVEVDRNAPLGMYALGAKIKKREKFAVYVVMRPTVTIYERADSPVEITAPQVVEVMNADGTKWTPGSGLVGEVLTPAELRERFKRDSVISVGGDLNKTMVQPQEGK